MRQVPKLDDQRISANLNFGKRNNQNKINSNMPKTERPKTELPRAEMPRAEMIKTEMHKRRENDLQSKNNRGNSSQKRNYQKEMEQVLVSESEEDHVPTLLLHSCCAPCSSYVFEYLTEYFQITDFFYNPNISPASEYEKRVDEIQRLIRELPVRHPITFVEGKYDPETFFQMAKGMEDIPEGGERCFACFELRLREAAEKAKELGCDYFTTSLTISPLKNAAKLNEIGERIGEEMGVKYLVSDFKKKNGYKRSIELSHEYDLYRQNYCGCVFSKREAEKRERKTQDDG